MNVGKKNEVSGDNPVLQRKSGTNVLIGEKSYMHCEIF